MSVHGTCIAMQCIQFGQPQKTGTETCSSYEESFLGVSGAPLVNCEDVNKIKKRNRCTNVFIPDYSPDMSINSIFVHSHDRLSQL